jgi:hypothetical protein
MSPQTEFSLTLTKREREILQEFLEQALKEARVETHRTESFQARKLMAEHEQILGTLVDKVRRLAP